MHPRRLRYHPMAKFLHWTTAVVVLVTIPLGLTMTNIGEGPTQNTLFDLHRSFGATVLALTAIRLLTRLTTGAPASEATIAPWQRLLSQIVHAMLYALLLLVPLLGWAGTSAFGAPITVFWLFQLPSILPKNEGFSELLLSLHGYAAYTLTALLSLHITAAIYHHFIRGDGVLRRMLPVK